MRILVIEDDLALSAGLCFELDSNGYLTVAAYNCRKARQLLQEDQFDLAIMDVNLPDGNGFDLCREVKAIKPELPVIFLTANDLEQDVLNGFDLGAEDYITKPFSMVLLGRRITALLRRSGKNTISDIVTFGDITVDFSGYTAKDPNGKIDITPKEIDLLRLLIEHKGLVLTRSQILDDLWGIDAPIIDRTIDTYIKNLRKKLRLDCIVTVKGIGYKYEVQP